MPDQTGVKPVLGTLGEGWPGRAKHAGTRAKSAGAGIIFVLPLLEFDPDQSWWR
jgi:hypothetical protein